MLCSFIYVKVSIRGVVVNKKQFAITMLLLLLMGCVALGQKFFGDKMVNLTVDNAKYKNYSILDGKYIYSIPEQWSVEQKQSPGNFIIYYSEFKYDNNGINGYVELIGSNDSIEELSKRNINIIKEESKNENIIIGDFKSEKYSGIKIDYEFRSSTGKVYNINEYIFKISDEYMVKYRFVRDKDKVTNDMQKDIFTIIDKFREK